MGAQTAAAMAGDVTSSMAKSMNGVRSPLLIHQNIGKINTEISQVAAKVLQVQDNIIGKTESKMNSEISQVTAKVLQV